MRELRHLIEEIQNAVVRASDAVIEKNLEVITKYFEPVAPGPDGGGEGEPFLGNFTPKLVAFEYPVMKPRHTPGPDTHRVFVPLVSLAPPASYYIDEVKLKLEIELHVDHEGTERFVFVAPRPRSGADTTEEGGQDTRSCLEIIIRRGERPMAVTQLIEGYDRAVRAEIPN